SGQDPRQNHPGASPASYPSSRSAASGSTRDARQAGSTPATAATTTSTTAAASEIPPSRGFTYNSTARIAPDPAHTRITQIQTHPNDNSSDSRNTPQTTTRCDAPNAIRTPKSGVRRATE